MQGYLLLRKKGADHFLAEHRGADATQNIQQRSFFSTIGALGLGVATSTGRLSCTVEATTHD